MNRWRSLGVALAALTASALPPAQAAPTAAQKIDNNKALIAFQRDLVSVAAPRADALPLLGAALLARPLQGQTKANGFHSLIDRAAAAPDAGPAMQWVRLADCDAKGGGCPNTDALTVLCDKAADNAAVWLLKLGQDQRDGRTDAARKDLSMAANAKLYDDYTGTSLQALATTVSLLPPPQDALDPRATSGAAGVQSMLVFGLASAQPQPVLAGVAKLCQEDAAAKDDCIKLGRTLEWGSSPLARSLGLHLRETLDADPTRQADAKRARVALVWQVESFARLTARVPQDKALAQHILALARRGGTEMSLLLAALRDYQLPTDPPDGWSPSTAGVGH